MSNETDKESHWFPNPEASDAQGLLAIGGDLSPPRLLAAYSQGIFPWFEPGCPILWWSPNPRLILKPQDFRVSHSLRKTLKKPFKYTIDTSFSEIIEACATEKGRKDNTWISKEMQKAYTALHTMGYAHSFEIWFEKRLVGGLYGVSLGRAFFGESMFHRMQDASKLAMNFLCQTMIAWEFDFIDCQIPTPHLQRLGATIISRQQFLHHLKESLEYPTRQGQWRVEDLITE